MDEWSAAMTIRMRMRDLVRGLALRALSTGRRIDATSNWIRFPYYHHVLDGERAGFERQLQFLRQAGEFISIDDAADLLQGPDPIDGRYICVGFDDGFKSCLTGALPILVEHAVPAVFYVVTSLMGRTLAPNDPITQSTFGFEGGDTNLEFLSWNDCREMIAAGMTIGSHTQTHVRLADITDAEAAKELTDSKAKIEQETEQPCHHFCAPYGLPDIDFSGRDRELAAAAGYRSFVTGIRGATRAGDDAYKLKRDHLLANWGNHQLRYFLSRN